MSDIPKFGVYKGMMTSYEESMKMSKTIHRGKHVTGQLDGDIIKLKNEIDKLKGEITRLEKLLKDPLSDFR